MEMGKTGHKIPLLKTKMVYLQHPHRLTCGRSVCQDLLPPLGFSPVLSASRWADRALVGSPHRACRNGIARTWLTRTLKEKPAKMKRMNWGSSLLSAAGSQAAAHSCRKHHASAELSVPTATADKSQEGLQGSLWATSERRGHYPTPTNQTPALTRLGALGKAQVSTEHSGPPGQLNSAPKRQFAEQGASAERAATWPHVRRQATIHQVFSRMQRCDLKQTLKTNLSSSPPWQSPCLQRDLDEERGVPQATSLRNQRAFLWHFH